MFAKILLVLFYLLAPAGVLWATRKFEVFRRLGPVLSLYILGVVVANVGIFPSDPEAHKSFLAFQESVSNFQIIRIGNFDVKDFPFNNSYLFTIQDKYLCSIS